jgi:hypothetical protein
MTAVEQSNRTDSERRYQFLTPQHFLVGLLMLVSLLFISERFQWFTYNEKKGWTVLVALVTVASAILLILIWFACSRILGSGFRFSLRSLFLLCFIVAIVLGWFAVDLQHARQQQTAIKAITNAGGRVFYSWELGVANARPPATDWLRRWLGVDFFSDADSIQAAAKDDPFGDDPFADAKWAFTDDDMAHLEHLPKLKFLALYGAPITDEGLSHVASLTSLKTLGLNDTKITDEGLLHLKRLTNLESLLLGSTRITDAGLAHLKRLDKLRNLVVGGTQITDAGLEQVGRFKSLRSLYLLDAQITDEGLGHVRGLTNLEQLGLDRTRITDAGLARLQPLTRLKRLSLGGTQITDAGLEHIQRLKNLERLEIGRTQVSDVGVNQLKQSLPNCEVMR